MVRYHEGTLAKEMDSSEQENTETTATPPISQLAQEPVESQGIAEPLQTQAVGPAIPPSPQPTPGKPRIQYQDIEDGLVQLPAYSRSLLKIKVPVMVTLAESKQPVENVLAIGPGSIIHFNKPCEESLALEIDGQKVALGEAVKVGDKFGLWITSMILPEERFWVIGNQPHPERAK